MSSYAAAAVTTIMILSRLFLHDSFVHHLDAHQYERDAVTRSGRRADKVQAVDDWRIKLLYARANRRAERGELKQPVR